MVDWKPGLAGLLNWIMARFRGHARAIGFSRERAVSQGRRIRAVLQIIHISIYQSVGDEPGQQEVRMVRTGTVLAEVYLMLI